MVVAVLVGLGLVVGFVGVLIVIRGLLVGGALSPLLFFLVRSMFCAGAGSALTVKMPKVLGSCCSTDGSISTPKDMSSPTKTSRNSLPIRL